MRYKLQGASFREHLPVCSHFHISPRSDAPFVACRPLHFQIFKSTHFQINFHISTLPHSFPLPPVFFDRSMISTFLNSTDGFRLAMGYKVEGKRYRGTSHKLQVSGASSCMLTCSHFHISLRSDAPFVAPTAPFSNFQINSFSN